MVSRPIYEMYEPAERGVPHYLVARDTLHFNDGWEEVRVEVSDLAVPHLVSVTIQHIGIFEDDPEHLPRIVNQVTLGARQTLALMKFIQRHGAFLRQAIRDEEPSNTPRE